MIDRLYEFVCTYTTATLVSSSLLYHNNLDVAINYSGGLHHAKQSEASGFCYVNDIVIAILEMLKYYQRILYVDIDIHHGDGVEEAFYTSNRVLTCSFHKFRDYFPGTGHIDDIGTDKGVYHAVNFPLNQGVDDESFTNIFKMVGIYNQKMDLLKQFCSGNQRNNGEIQTKCHRNAVWRGQPFRRQTRLLQSVN